MRMAVLLVIFSLAACSPSADSPVEATSPDASRNLPTADTVVVLAIGEAAVVGELTLGLVDVPGDSRCPVDVTCVWAGDVTVVVTTVVGGIERVLALHLNPVGDGVRSVTVDGYAITLTTVEPEPHSGRSIPRAEYRATFEVGPV